MSCAAECPSERREGAATSPTNLIGSPARRLDLDHRQRRRQSATRALALGKPILYAGKEVVIHLTCKDQIETGPRERSLAAQQRGFHNILAMTGDSSGRRRRRPRTTGVRPRFRRPDFDAEQMNPGGFDPKARAALSAARLGQTQFCIGAVTTNFKWPRAKSCRNTSSCGRKSRRRAIHHQPDRLRCAQVQRTAPVHGPVRPEHHPSHRQCLSVKFEVAQILSEGKIPGIVVTPPLLELCRKHGQSADGGKVFFLEFAAKQIAIYRGSVFAACISAVFIRCRAIEKF